MTIQETISWYRENVGEEITEPFLEHLIGIKIIDRNIDLKRLNLFLLKDGKLKDNVKSVLHIYEKKEEEKIDEIVVKPINKFKIEKINGNKLKLIRKK